MIKKLFDKYLENIVNELAQIRLITVENKIQLENHLAWHSRKDLKEKKERDLYRTPID